LPFLFILRRIWRRSMPRIKDRCRRSASAAMLAARIDPAGVPMTAPTLRWPPSGDEPRLVTIESFVLIGRPA
jgi:hypothetical protein